jgi:hypothetical protein
MAAVGSLLDHSGPIGESEKYAARVFGAHRSYTVTNGTSGSNRIIFLASLILVMHGMVSKGWKMATATRTLRST